MKGDGKTFRADLAAFAELSNTGIEKVYRGVLIKLFGAVIQDTPVDTGALRGNWRTSVKQPLLRALKRKSGQESMNEVRSKLAKADPRVTAYLTNNLPYAERIEYDGWSHTKAPEGMVRKNVLRFERLIKQEIRRLR